MIYPNINFISRDYNIFSFLSLKQLNNRLGIRSFDNKYKLSFCLYNYLLSRSIVVSKINNGIKLSSSSNFDVTINNKFNYDNSFSTKLSYFLWRKYYISKRIIRRSVPSIRSIGNNSFLHQGRLSSSKLIKMRNLSDSIYRVYNFYERSIMDINRLAYQGKRLFKKTYINRLVNKHNTNVAADAAYFIQKNSYVGDYAMTRTRRLSNIARKLAFKQLFIAKKIKSLTKIRTKLELLKKSRRFRTFKKRNRFKISHSIKLKLLQRFKNKLLSFRRYKSFNILGKNVFFHSLALRIVRLLIMWIVLISLEDSLILILVEAQSFYAYWILIEYLILLAPLLI